MWSCDQVLVTLAFLWGTLIYGFVQKTDFEGWSWSKVYNLGLALGMVLKFYSSVAKRFKLKAKVLRETSRGPFCTSPPPPILNRVKNELTHFLPVKTIKKEKYKFHCFIARIVKVTCIVTVIVLESMFENIEISCFYLRGNKVGETALVDLACLQMLNISLREIWNPHNPQIAINNIEDWICRH